MKRSFIIVSLVAILSMFVMVSCNGEVSNSANSGTTDLKLAISYENAAKKLDTGTAYSAGLVPVRFEYKAACDTTPGAQGTKTVWTLFGGENTNSTGVVTIGENPTALATSGTGTARLEKMARGTWTIDIRAKNDEGGVILQGQATGVRLMNDEQELAIELKNTVTAFAGTSDSADTDEADDVEIQIGVAIPSIASGNVIVKYAPIASLASLSPTASSSPVSTVTMDSTDGTDVRVRIDSTDDTTLDLYDDDDMTEQELADEGSTTGWTSFVGQIDDIKPGLYVMGIYVWDDKDGDSTVDRADNQHPEYEEIVSGQVMAFRVADKANFAIAGTLTSGEFLDLVLTPITVDSTFITVTATTPAAVTSGTLASTVTATSEVGLLRDVSYTWFLDGEAVSGQTLASFSMSNFTKTNKHVLSVLVQGTIGGRAADPEHNITAISGVSAIGYLSQEFEVQ